jgi:hypothetical protein
MGDAAGENIVESMLQAPMTSRWAPLPIAPRSPLAECAAVILRTRKVTTANFCGFPLSPLLVFFEFFDLAVRDFPHHHRVSCIRAGSSALG